MGATSDTVGIGEGERQPAEENAAEHAPRTGTATSDQLIEPAHLSMSDIYEILYNPRRRDIVEYLRAADGPVTRSDLAEYLAAEETDQAISEVSSYDRKRLYIGLYQTHLPKLAEMGVISYDEDRGTIELREAVHQLEPYLEQPSLWPPARYDLVLAGALGGCLLLGVAGVGAFGVIPPVTWTVLGLVGLLLLVVFRTIRFRTRGQPNDSGGPQ